MKDKILNMREAGMSYNEIVAKLGCSKSLVNYYCSKDGKTKVLARKKKARAKQKRSKHKHTDFLREFTWRYRKLCGCNICGNKDPRVLDFDHIVQKYKTANVSAMVNRGNNITSVKREIRKCRVLCANCHRIETFHQLEYWTPTQI